MCPLRSTRTAAPPGMCPPTPRRKELFHTASLCSQNVPTSSAGLQKEVTFPGILKGQSLGPSTTAYPHKSLPHLEMPPVCTHPPPSFLKPLLQTATPSRHPCWGCQPPCPQARTTKGASENTGPQPPLATLPQTGMRLFHHFLQHIGDPTGTCHMAPQKVRG